MTTKTRESSDLNDTIEPAFKLQNSVSNSNTLDSWMPDKVLQKIVAANLGQPIKQITKESLANLTELSLIAPSEMPIVHGKRKYAISPAEYRLRLRLKSLAGLEYATNLVKINLAPDRQLNSDWCHRAVINSTLADISALKNLYKLTNINLEMCNLHDISALANKPQLVQLNLSYNAITDFSPLKSNKQLIESGSLKLRKQIILAEPVHLTAGTTSYTSGPYQLLDFNGKNMTLKVETGKHLSAKYPVKQYSSNWNDHVGQVNGKQTVTWDLSGLQSDDSATMTVKFHSRDSAQEPIISGWYIIPFRIVSGQPITIHFKDDADNTIACQQKLYGSVNTSSTITIPTFTGYSISSKSVDGTTTPISQDSVTATITAQPQEVILIYTRNKAADITVHFQDETGKPIAPESTISGVFSEQKIIQPQDISGYTPSHYQIDHNGISHHPGSVAIVLNNQPQEITFYYNREKVSNVIVHYQDTAGKKVAPDEILSGFVNDQQTAPALKLSGYTVKLKDFNGSHIDTDLNATAITLKQKPQELTYIYTKNILSSKNTVKEVKTHNYKHSEKLHLNSKIQSLVNNKKHVKQPRAKTITGWQLGLLLLGLISLFSVLGLAIIYYNRKSKH
ncbi:MucBP domain-containing protein [Lactobacillus juensis]|uniref:MucBP domain-containing protein n=1 Tax=Lactobacillus juensis TaxID=3082862 RepID=UPI0030C69A4D